MPTDDPVLLQSNPVDIKLRCESVWKLFGDLSGVDIAQQSDRLTDEKLKALNVIGAVRDVNLDIHTGEIFVIMGLSGSGKSTLVRCMSRLVDPSFGRIVFEGQDLLAASPREMIEIRRHKMGMVFQHFALLPHLTVLKNVAFPLEVQGVDRKQREEQAMELIELVGLHGREQYYPRQLSGGQQQRVGIARSLAVKPEIWFLDEPFSALDPLIRREMQDEFLRLQSVLKKTIVFITHDFDEAIRLADRMAIMRHGLVEQIGTPEQLVLYPASDYVAEFTKDVSRSKVVTAGSIMRPLNEDSDYRHTVPVADTIGQHASDIIAGGAHCGVVDEGGKLVGEVSVEDVLKVLVDKPPPRAGA